jgi:hypothetical protein
MVDLAGAVAVFCLCTAMTSSKASESSAGVNPPAGILTTRPVDRVTECVSAATSNLPAGRAGWPLRS